MAEARLRNESGEIIDNNINHTKVCIVLHLHRHFLKTVHALEAQQCTSQPGGSEGNDDADEE